MKTLEDCIASLDQIERDVQDLEFAITETDGTPGLPSLGTDLFEQTGDILRQVRNLQWEMRHLAARPRGQDG
jgi:hypothetical protein